MRVAVVGLGKMGLAHLAQIMMVDGVEVVAVCDSAAFMLGLLRSQTGLHVCSDYRAMLDQVALDAVVIVTPSRSHVAMARAALERGLHVFCEKPLTLSPQDSEMLCELADARGLINQVGYHHRFMGTFREVKRLLDAGAIGAVSHASAEAYGPVVLRPAGATWRARREEGGGCLYDYAAHPINLLNWYMGRATGVGGTALNRIFSANTEDEVHATLFFERASARVAVNWSDESQRKMCTKVTIWGSTGRIYADRQEVQLFARNGARLPHGYHVGWNTRYTTDLTVPVGFYVRGEEYAAQFEHFVAAVRGESVASENDFASAAETDRVLAMLLADAQQPRGTATPARRRRLTIFGR